MSDLSLKLPIIRGPLSEKRQLSMDEYLKFVQFNLKYTVDRKTIAEWKKLRAVDVPFTLKYRGERFRDNYKNETTF